MEKFILSGGYLIWTNNQDMFLWVCFLKDILFEHITNICFYGCISLIHWFDYIPFFDNLKKFHKLFW